MSSILTLEAKLERVDPKTPWGFRMQGGKEFGCPLTILKVNDGSLAAKCGLQQGDIILKIGNNETTNHKHKEAQDLIIGSGNKLDLLLQRIRDKHSGSPRGGPTPQRTYETFSAPTINSYQSPVGTSQTGSQNYNTSARPFGSTPSRPSHDVDSVTQHTNNLTFSPKPAPVPASSAPDFYSAAQKYTEREEKPAPAQHNTSARPFGSTPSRPSHDVDSVTQHTNNMTFSPKPAPVPAPSAPDFYSAAQKYTEREEKPAPAQHQSRSFKYLQDIIDSGQEPPSSLRPAPGQTVKSPQTTLQTTQQTTPITKPANFNSMPRQFSPAQGLYSEENINSAYKMQSRDQPAPVHQEAHPVAPASSAPKPSTWTPPSAPTAKPFTPTVAPPAPAAPGGPKTAPPRNPTGVNAVRAKRGEATIFKSGDMAPGGARIPICASCGSPIRGPFVVALGKTWCPDHFVCQNPRCGTKLLDIGFVEEGGFLYCEKDYEQYFAPTCSSCGKAIVGECVNALQKTYHPNCFLCYQCKKPIGGNQFHLEDGHAYCENDWRQMFQTMCKGCDFPIEPGDHWVEAMGNNYHSECFNCSTCGVNLEGQPFYNKGGKPYCKKHTR